MAVHWKGCQLRIASVLQGTGGEGRGPLVASTCCCSLPQHHVSGLVLTPVQCSTACLCTLHGLFPQYNTKILTECSAGLSHVCGHRFAAVRTLNKVAMTHPMAVTNCNIDMESLISDQNRSIATLAITTLLKTGNESSVDRLLKQVPLLHTHPFALLAMACACSHEHVLHCKFRHLSAVAPGLRLVQTS